MRITRKFPLAFLFTAVGTAGAIFFSLSQVLTSSMEKEISKRGTTVAESFATANAPLLLRLPAPEDKSRLQFNVNALASDPDVVTARVADHHGVIQAATDMSEVGAVMPSFFTDRAAEAIYSDTAARAYHFRSTMRYGGVDVGTFVVTLSRLPLEAAVRTARDQALVFTAGIALLMSLLALLFVRREVRPIATLATRLLAVAKGEFDERMPETRKDELGDLARAFNLMARRTQLFLHYVDKVIIERLIADESLTKPGGKLHDLAVVFGDMRGYTAMSNRRTADEMVANVNTYFHLYIECITHMGGVVDKTMGDAIMAVFERGADEDFEGHKRRSLSAIAYMKAAQRVLNVFLRQRIRDGEVLAIEPAEFGFAVASGKAIVGNMGSWRHMDYTVCGRVVNLAARLEGLTKHGEVILDNFTRLGASELCRSEPLPPVQPKGYSERERVTPHRLVALSDTEMPKLRTFQKQLFSYGFVYDALTPPTLGGVEKQRWCDGAQQDLHRLVDTLPVNDFFALVDPQTGAPMSAHAP